MSLILKAALLAGIPLVTITAIGVALLVQGQESYGRSTLAVGVIVAASAGSSVIFQIDRWTFGRQTFVHFALMTVTVLPALFLSGWFEVGTLGGLLMVVGLFLAVGALLWTTFSVIERERHRRALLSR